MKAIVGCLVLRGKADARGPRPWTASARVRRASVSAHPRQKADAASPFMAGTSGLGLAGNALKVVWIGDQAGRDAVAGGGGLQQHFEQFDRRGRFQLSSAGLWQGGSGLGIAFEAPLRRHR